ncbi:MAG: hypothetical protein LQ343_003068 [Gyalolechia ehrenbergii]|nr:MAG: hypothetical protein LQ343_003068 [Gyalolechia ehrenbergii]
MMGLAALSDYSYRNSDVGGTWFENTYPGVGCDVPSHSYTFSFEPNAEWDGYYANGAQIQKYLLDFCDKYNLRQYMRLETTVIGATWLDDKGQWELDLQSRDDTRFEDRCHVLISGSGPLNRWKCAKSFTLFSRSGQWITPPAGMQDIRVIPDSEYSSHPAPAGKHFYTHEGKEVMRNDPERFLKYRKGVDSAMQASFPIFLRDSQFHDHAITMMTCMIKQHIGPGRPDLEQLFIPLFSPGCRRNTPGEGFLEALTEDHVECVSAEIVKSTELGIMASDGKEREFDIVICATGFDVAFAPH